MMREPAALIGFADSGAHIRNMAFYSFPLRMLKVGARRRARRTAGDAARARGVAADRRDRRLARRRRRARCATGDRADVVVIDPAALDERLDAYHEAPMESLGGLSRMVNRSRRRGARGRSSMGASPSTGGAFDRRARARRAASALPAGARRRTRLMPAVRDATQEERREATIRKLLDAATEALIEVGYAGASVQEVCARAERVARAGCSGTSRRARS